MEASKIANGNAIGTKVINMYQNNCKITKVSNPLPITLSKIFHINCKSNTNSDIENVSRRGPKKDFIIRISNFFTPKFYN